MEETPAPEPAPTITPGEGFSEDGNLVTRDLLYDAATNKQFITVETSGGNTFYLVIDYETFDKVQALLQRDTRTSPKGREVHLFSGFLKCADCGRAITPVSYTHLCWRRGFAPPFFYASLRSQPTPIRTAGMRNRRLWKKLRPRSPRPG